MTEIHKYNVFLSYASEDRDRAASISKLLEQKGFISSFSDVNDIYWNSQTSILDAFFNSAVCLLVIGSDQRSPWWDDCIGVAVDERVRSSHGEFRVVSLVIDHAADKFDVAQYRDVPVVSDAVIHWGDSLTEADKLNDLIMLIRRGKRTPQFLADPVLRAWAKLRTKNALRVDWTKLCYRYSQAEVCHSLGNLLTKAPSREQQSAISYEESFDTKSESITQLLKRWSTSGEKAWDQLTPLVYDELHRIAEGYLRRERREHTLQPTELVNELFLKFFDQNSMSWQNRAQFFGLAAQMMRRILVDHARAHHSVRGHGDRLSASLRDDAAFGAQPDADLLALHDVLNQLEELDPAQGKIVELRFFGGLTTRETAEVMQISHARVEREWRTAKMFLKRELTRGRHLIQERDAVEEAQEEATIADTTVGEASIGEAPVMAPITSISISTSYSLSLEFRT